MPQTSLFSKLSDKDKLEFLRSFQVMSQRYDQLQARIIAERLEALRRSQIATLLTSTKE